MAFVTNNQGSIMTSRAAKGLLEELHRRLAQRMADMESHDYLALLSKVRDELLREENVDAWVNEEMAALRDRLAAARLVDDLKPLCAKLTELTTRHFQARSSVGSFQEFTCSFVETLLATAARLAEDLLRLEGHAQQNVSWCLLSSDSLGRREATRKGHNAILFIHGDAAAEQKEYLHHLALRLVAILRECAMPLHIGLQRNGHVFWHGSLSEWREFLQRSTDATAGQSTGSASDHHQEESYARTIEIMADLRPLCGDTTLAGQITDTAEAFLNRERERDQFRHLARRVATMPVALGIFGRFRTARSGKHRGEFSLEEMATGPLVSSVRIMAILAGIRQTSTTERIKSLIASGSIGVTLADRLLVALHEFVRCQIELEMSERIDGEGYFFNPGLLDDRARERLKTGLEDLTTLQRLLYQQITEVDQR